MSNSIPVNTGRQEDEVVSEGIPSTRLRYRPSGDSLIVDSSEAELEVLCHSPHFEKFQAESDGSFISDPKNRLLYSRPWFDGVESLSWNRIEEGCVLSKSQALSLKRTIEGIGRGYSFILIYDSVNDMYSVIHKDGIIDNNSNKLLSAIESQVLYHFGIRLETITGRSRLRTIVYPRMCVALMLKTFSYMSYMKIGGILNRNHSSIIHYLDKSTKSDGAVFLSMSVDYDYAVICSKIYHSLCEQFSIARKISFPKKYKESVKKLFE